MTTNHEICHLNDIPDGGCRGFVIVTENSLQKIFIVRQDKQVYGYVNRCPHTGVNLDWIPDQFLDLERKFIMCSTHGAKFRIRDGHCLLGPCRGDHLQPVTIDIENDQLYLIIKNSY